MTDSTLTGEAGLRPSGQHDAAERLRQAIVERLATGAAHEAMQLARALLDAAPGRRTHRFLRDAADRSDATSAGLRPLTVALLASFSIEFLHDALTAFALAAGLKLTLYQPPFATFRQELLNAGSGLYAASPDVALLAVEAEDWSTAPFGDFLAGLGAQNERAVAAFEGELTALVAAFRANSQVPLIVHNLALPPWRKLGLFDAKAADGQGPLLERMNAAIAAVARKAPDVHVADYAALVNRHGALNWYDERLRLYARAPIAGSMQAHLAEEYVKFFRALTGSTKKCLVLDLDNTLWGGIIGEDGVDGIALGATYPGSAYVRFQQSILDLRKRGTILAIASKNNAVDVDEVFSQHPSMLLRREHFAASEIHWEPKSESLRRIAERLSIGLEHMVLVEDSPAECEEVRRALPQVQVILLPSQPEHFPAALAREGLFDAVALSAEDRRRGELYRVREQAEAARASSGSLEGFYRDLAMEVAVAPIGGATLTRAAQLTQKTNQFNVTTRRYSEAELAERLRDPSSVGFTIAVKDRFGDNGIVGVAIAEANDEALEIDTLLMSCRVIGRTVETAMLASLCDEATRRGLFVLRGTVVPTPKNAPARDLFERHAFARERERDEGATEWRLDLRAARVEWPDWFTQR